MLGLLFVMVLHMGVPGAAIATVIAQTISAVLCGVYTLRSYAEYMPRRADFRVPPETLADLLSTGFGMALMITVIDFGSLIYQRANNAFGEIVITSHMAARRIVSICMQPLSSIASALSTFTGQNFGAGKRARIRAAIRQTCLMVVGFSVTAFLVLFLAGSSLVRLVTGTSDRQHRAKCVMGICFLAASYPALGVLLGLRSSMKAMSEERAPIIAS